MSRGGTNASAGSRVEMVTVTLVGTRLTVYDCYGNSYISGELQTEKGKMISAEAMAGYAVPSGDYEMIADGGANNRTLIIPNGAVTITRI